jgi:UDP-N-acetyl-D-glucosamine dehydrogenase
MPAVPTPTDDEPLPSDQAQALAELIQNKKATIGVVGLGYVGLPLIRAFIDAGFRCLGFDVDPAKVDSLTAGKSYINHIPSAWIARCVEEKKFDATIDMKRLSEADAILICVPTPLSESRDPDLSYVEQTAENIRQSLRPGQLVVLESTTYPGTTRDVVLPKLAQSGLAVGRDFFLAYSPEREDPGNPDFTASTIPKVVGATEPAGLELATQLYGHAVTDIVPVSSAEIAEACKILENTYRSVNIAMVNELKMLFDRLGIDVWEVIDAAKTKPFGYQAFYPGPGLGGHCIPIDPFYLSWIARRQGMPTRFIELAGEINTSMPQYVIDRLSEALNELGKPIKGSRILLLGLAYKPDIGDARESPSFRLLELLEQRGAVLSYNDPYLPKLPKTRSFDVADLESVDLTPGLLADQDCVLIATDHSCYDFEMIAQHASLIIDTRNATRDLVANREKIRKA